MRQNLTDGWYFVWEGDYRMYLTVDVDIDALVTKMLELLTTDEERDAFLQDVIEEINAVKGLLEEGG